jgi:hypothetical protein
VEAPAWLLDKVSLQANGVTPALPPEAWRELVTRGAVEGTRNNAIAKVAGHLLRRRIDPFRHARAAAIVEFNKMHAPASGRGR